MRTRWLHRTAMPAFTSPRLVSIIVVDALNAHRHRSVAYPPVVTACASPSCAPAAQRVPYARRLRALDDCIVQRCLRSRLLVSSRSSSSMRRRASVSVGGVAVRRDRMRVAIACTQLRAYRTRGSCAHSMTASYSDACRLYVSSSPSRPSTLWVRRRASVSVDCVAVRRDRMRVPIVCTQLSAYRACAGCARSVATSSSDACCSNVP